MTLVSRLDEAESIFLEDLVDYYEGIWRLARMVRDALGTGDSAAVREVTLKLARDWLVAGLVRAGVPHGYDTGFSAWTEEGVEAAEKIAAKWGDADKLPTLGEIAWLAITPEGERLVEERLAGRAR